MALRLVAMAEQDLVDQNLVEQKYVDYWRSRQARRIAREKALEQAAWADVEKAACLLKEQFGATKVIVFGSLVKDRFGEDSDIDIAVEGIESADFLPALTAVNELGERWIDLKPMESLDPAFKERVLSTGRLISANQ